MRIDTGCASTPEEPNNGTLNISLEAVLSFIREADRDQWHLVATEIRSDTTRKDLMAARSFRVGQTVTLLHFDGRRRVTGHIIKINRSKGRVAVLADFGEGHLTQYSLPASMVMASRIDHDETLTDVG